MYMSMGNFEMTVIYYSALTIIPNYTFFTDRLLGLLQKQCFLTFIFYLKLLFRHFILLSHF